MNARNLDFAPLIDNLGGYAGFGENFINRNDDESSAFVDITSVFENGLNFFGTNYQGFYINNNGNITFNAPLANYTPFNLTGDTGIPIIAPFFADVDTRLGSLLPSSGGNSTGSNLVYWDLDPQNDTITITWDDVGQFVDDYTGGDVPNAFQLILRDLGAQHFHMEFRYEDIRWTVGGASDNEYARIGYSAADGENFLELSQSGDNEQLLGLETASNIEQPGRFIFSVINGIPQGIEVEEDVIEPNQPKTELVSLSNIGLKGNNNSENSVISADGRYVVFESYATNLVSGDNNVAKDIFVRDLVNETIERVSVNSNGIQGNGDSTNPSISADGRYIAFESEANNFFAGDSGFYSNVFVHDTLNNTTTPVTTSYATDPSISADGRYVAYQASSKIFVKDLVNDTTEIASLATGGYEANEYSQRPSISADGRYVAFVSGADNLVPGDVNDTYDIFVRDLVNDTTEIVSVNTDGNTLNTRMSFNPVISDNGRYVAFWSSSNNLVANDNNYSRDIFVRDLVNDTTKLVTAEYAGSGYDTTNLNFDISADGRYVTYLSTSGVAVKDLVKDTTTILDIDSTEENISNLLATPTISTDGRYVAFQSAANILNSNDTNLSKDVFMRDRGEFFDREDVEPPQQTTPSIEITSLTQGDSSNEVTINYSAFDSNSQAEIKLFYDNNNLDRNGILITDDLIEANGAGSFTWNAEPEDLIAGNYYVYAMISDEEGNYAFDYSEQTIEVSEILPDNLPTVVNPLVDVSVDENASNKTIDLSNVFNDLDGDAISLTVDRNTNSSLVSTYLVGSDLILDFASDRFGTSDITIEATANGKKVSDTFSVTVNEIKTSPYPAYVVNPLTDITVNENTEDRIIDLFNVFGDPDGYITNLEVKNNTNSSIVTTSIQSGYLTLDFADDRFGTSEITIEATTRTSGYEDEKISDTFTVTVNEVADESQLLLTDVHRFYQYQKGFHLYTSDDNEIRHIKDKTSLGELAYSYEAEKYRVLADNKNMLTGAEIEGVAPIYRFFNTDTGSHLYTMNEVEKHHIQNNLSNYSFEGIKYYAFKSEPENMDTIPVYRMLNTQSGAHLFSSDLNEINHIEQNQPHFAMENNGNAAFYVFEL